jgi:hypothetical protein
VPEGGGLPPNGPLLDMLPDYARYYMSPRNPKIGRGCGRRKMIYSSRVGMLSGGGQAAGSQRTFTAPVYNTFLSSPSIVSHKDVFATTSDNGFSVYAHVSGHNIMLHHIVAFILRTRRSALARLLPSTTRRLRMSISSGSFIKTHAQAREPKARRRLTYIIPSASG